MLQICKVPRASLILMPRWQRTATYLDLLCTQFMELCLTVVTIFTLLANTEMRTVNTIAS